MIPIPSNPTITISGTINGSNIQGLFCAIRETTGLLYGYLPFEMIDTGFYKFVLTLNKKPRLPKKLKPILDATIRAWCIGYGLGNPRIDW